MNYIPPKPKKMNKVICLKKRSHQKYIVTYQQHLRKQFKKNGTKRKELHTTQT